MKVRVDYEEEVTNLQRRAIAYRYGWDRLASEQNVIDFFMIYGNGNSVLNQLVHEYKTSTKGYSYEKL